ncbi:MAG: hypothetical protein COZ70_12205 [Deltaproteobacteria bacterium CG_4_8_14_3_um_filter_51_11]|nr:MAG: hypothetical protein AUK25_03175 [Desulfobacteraceae bacterium CG2_30_51_40]PIP46344.1 MAG: hypothetical protein COX16_09390 [Deltaproteobacteria bacterium CG23_combo_of_CG06-09_8_20_14_all_51_20]PIX18806.1 MAG: hypothetical protein COZ70_12205 [Deltaproteobacteria bacterium CG_4_8_14_3_um_filter_51_11]PJB35855.1 MAG: hypothetical protein CO107_09510 [Deltaproteobacteria bacterium CG_4_9_14_3_um_filter_51_14]
MKITPTLPPPWRGRNKGKAHFHINGHALKGAQHSMKMPHVIPDLIRNPGINDWIPAYAVMTTYFHKK